MALTYLSNSIYLPYLTYILLYIPRAIVYAGTSVLTWSTAIQDSTSVHLNDLKAIGVVGVVVGVIVVIGVVVVYHKYSRID